MSQQPPPPQPQCRALGGLHIPRPAWNPSAVPPPDTIDAEIGSVLQTAIRDRDCHSESLLLTKVTQVKPLPPPQFHAHQERAPYQAPLPALQRADDPENRHLVQARWLATTVHTLAAATAACAQTIYIRHELAHYRFPGPPQEPAPRGVGPAGDIQATPSPAEPEHVAA